MKRLLLNSTTVFTLLITCCLSVHASHLEDKLLISSWLTGAQEIPSVVTSATGVASFRLNSTRDSLCVNISVNGLSGPITGIHVHEGSPAMNGSIITDLTSFVTGNRIETVLTGSDLTPAMLSKYLSGEYYLNVHTTANPAGEIRGQLELETDWSFKARLDTAQHTHIVTNNAFGLSIFNLSKDESTLNVYVVVDALSGPISATHLHFAPSGTAGPVGVDLSSLINGNNIVGSIDVSTIVGLRDSLLAGKVYLNIHTSANPAGELRGQLMLDNKISFDAWMNGSQTIPASGASATGVANISINTTFDTLWYHIQVEGLTGPISAIHFHDGTIGMSGGVLIDLSTGINGNIVSGIITGASLTSNINNFINGGVYVNLHTSTNPAGEIRGQVYRVAREGLTLNLQGSQEVPAISVSGAGSGLVSIDRDQTNAHFMMVLSDLTAPLSGAHFHNEAAGNNGGVIHDISSFFMATSADDAAAGYWKDTDGVPFTTAISSKFLNDSIYVNVHTSANPVGELRGQVLRNDDCFLISTGIKNETTNGLEIKVYPNPISDLLSIDLGKLYHNITIIVYDINGKNLMTDKFNEKQSINLSLEELADGLYFIHVRIDKWGQVLKIVKRK